MRAPRHRKFSTTLSTNGNPQALHRIETAMNRRSLLTRLAAIAGAAALPSAHAADNDRVTRTPDEWRKTLTPEQFYILREEGTERPYSSPLNNEKHKGTFVCAGCALPLFTSDTKFESGTGWPSFYAPIAGAVATKVDYKLIVPRTEYHCRRCDGHQGHVFDDGPKPTGLRYCNNGVALKFVPA
jgi:peptide-methionine (R)-S-oxide reductase